MSKLPKSICRDGYILNSKEPWRAGDRATDQVLLLHREEEHPGLCAQVCHALPSQLRQGQALTYTKLNLCL